MSDVSEETPSQPSPEQMETQVQRETAYRGFVEGLTDKFSQEPSTALTLVDHQTLHLKSAEGRPFYLERPTPDPEVEGNMKLMLEEPKPGYDYNTIEYRVGDDGTVTKESYSRRSKPEPEPAEPREYEDSQMKFNREGDSQMQFNEQGDSQMRYNRKMDKRLEGTPPQPISAREADQLTELVSQSSAA
jgi:hypothetical protein